MAPPTPAIQASCTLSVGEHHIPIMSLLDGVLQAPSQWCTLSQHITASWSSNLDQTTV